MQSKRFLTTLIFLLLVQLSFAQKEINLEELLNTDYLVEDKAILYGTFVQRLGFSSGGFPQDIQLQNTDTKEIVSFRVKPTFKSAKRNIFIIYIEPGNYVILNYWWTKSTWYGGKTYTEPIYRDFDSFNYITPKEGENQLIQANLEQFKLTIQANTLYYVGTWHFDQSIVSFTNDKEELDLKIARNHPNLDFKKAKVHLPE
ncbi:hypothetical protein [Myroides odoratus]|uniref:hypothetical protein n=1 Tax=Myroides TaxID=76831 RepID=UPI00333F5376